MTLKNKELILLLANKLIIALLTGKEKEIKCIAEKIIKIVSQR